MFKIKTTEVEISWLLLPSKAPQTQNPIIQTFLPNLSNSTPTVCISVFLLKNCLNPSLEKKKKPTMTSERFKCLSHSMFDVAFVMQETPLSISSTLLLPAALRCSIFFRSRRSIIAWDVHSEQLPHCTAIAEAKDRPGGMTVSLKVVVLQLWAFLRATVMSSETFNWARAATGGQRTAFLHRLHPVVLLLAAWLQSVDNMPMPTLTHTSVVRRLWNYGGNKKLLSTK